MVLAVLEAHCGVKLSTYDVYLNVAGGLRSRNPPPTLPRGGAGVLAGECTAAPDASISARSRCRCDSPGGPDLGRLKKRPNSALAARCCPNRPAARRWRFGPFAQSGRRIDQSGGRNRRARVSQREQGQFRSGPILTLHPDLAGNLANVRIKDRSQI